VATGSEMKAAMNALVRSRLTDLRRESFTELAALPGECREELIVHEKAVALTTYRVERAPDRLLIVVQTFRNTLAGISAQISVEGFLVSPNGDLESAPEEELWDFT